MNPILKRTILPTLMATSLLGVPLLSIKPASANDNLIRDIGIGAATGVVTGTVTNHNSGLTNGINGAAAGAAVHATHNAFGSHRGHRDLVRDTAVGAGAGLVTGTITNRHHPLSNTIDGAAAGAAVNLLSH